MIDLRIRRLIGIVALGLSHLPPAEAVGSTSGQMPALSVAKMMDCSGLPCVDLLTQDGKHLTLAVDTGNPTSLLSDATAQKLGLTLMPYKTLEGKIIPNVHITSLAETHLGSGSLGKLKFGVIDLSKPIADKTFPAVDGTIAYNAFTQRVLRLDYAGRIVGYSNLLPAALPCPVATCGKLSLIPFGNAGPPIVVSSGFTVNGHSLNVQIDTMFTGTMLIFPPAVGKLGLNTLSASKIIRHFAFTDEGVDMIEAGPVSEGFGNDSLLEKAPIYFAGPKVHLPDGLFDGTVGAELFAGRRLNLDFSGMSVWIDSSPREKLLTDK